MVPSHLSTRVGDTIYMLHGFTKKSAKTSRNDLAIAKTRLKAVRARILEEKKNAKKDKDNDK